MRIPKHFSLMGYTVEVQYSDTLVDTEDRVGSALYRQSKIVLQSNCLGVSRSKQQIEQTYCHELVHFILRSMHALKECDNEGFVECFSGFLHQFMSTAYPIAVDYPFSFMLGACVANWDEGKLDLSGNAVYLDGNIDNLEARQCNFYQALTSLILMLMAEKELLEDTKFVNLFGILLHQALETAEYDE